jgi:hypothetical protein
VHHRSQSVPNTCLSYERNIITPNKGQHSIESCEHAYASTVEGIASFFGTRSLITNEANNQAFFCFCNPNIPNTSQDLCSATAAGPMDADRQVDCVAAGGDDGVKFSGVGDDFADDDSHCATLFTTFQCDCPDSTNGLCTGSWPITHGYRNEANITRFLWDAIDTHSDSGRPDDLDESVESVVANFEAMRCTGICDGSAASDCGDDNSCNEPNADPCDPVLDYYPLPGYPEPMTGTRDAYNAWELRSQIISGPSRFEEARNNCVHGARD